jgi:hypothetical protein
MLSNLTATGVIGHRRKKCVAMVAFWGAIHADTTVIDRLAEPWWAVRRRVSQNVWISD